MIDLRSILAAVVLLIAVAVIVSLLHLPWLILAVAAVLVILWALFALL